MTIRGRGRKRAKERVEGRTKGTIRGKKEGGPRKEEEKRGDACKCLHRTTCSYHSCITLYTTYMCMSMTTLLSSDLPWALPAGREREGARKGGREQR